MPPLPLGLNSALGPPAALQIVVCCRILLCESEIHLTSARNGLFSNVRRSNSSFPSSYVADNRRHDTDYATQLVLLLQQNPQAQTPVHFGCVAAGDSAGGAP